MKNDKQFTKKVSSILLIATALFLSLPSIFSQQSATDCIDLQLSRQSYLAGEIFQIEISGNFLKPLTNEDIHFYYNNKEYTPALGFEQAASNKWILWMTAPKNYGSNVLQVNALCKQETLKEESKKVTFTIQRPLQDAYSWLKFEAESKINQLSTEELSLSLSALSFESDA